MNLNDLENIPAILVAGLLFVLSEPPLVLAHALFWGFVVSRAAHFIAYVTAQLHDVRATLWTISSISVITMVVYTLLHALTF